MSADLSFSLRIFETIAHRSLWGWGLGIKKYTFLYFHCSHDRRECLGVFNTWSFKGPSLKSSPVNPDWNVGLFDLCFLPLMVCLKTSFDQKLVNGQKSVSLKSPVCAQNDSWSNASHCPSVTQSFELEEG